MPSVGLYHIARNNLMPTRRQRRIDQWTISLSAALCLPLRSATLTTLKIASCGGCRSCTQPPERPLVASCTQSSACRVRVGCTRYLPEAAKKRIGRAKADFRGVCAGDRSDSDALAGGAPLLTSMAHWARERDTACRRRAPSAGRQEMHRPVRPAHVGWSGSSPTVASDRQWLKIERDGQFIQLTELLYRVVEHGRRTEKIWRRSSLKTSRPVSGGNITTLISARSVRPVYWSKDNYRACQLPPRQDRWQFVCACALGPRVIDPVARCCAGSTGRR